MNPFKFAAAACVLIGSLITLTSSKRVPNADTPLFYLVSSTTTDPGVNLLPLKVGASGGLSTLGISEPLATDSGEDFLPLIVNGEGRFQVATHSNSEPIAQLYFFQGKFVLLDSTESSTLQGFINFLPISSGCTTYGRLGFAVSSSNKCAKFGGFEIESDTEDSQLGAFLVVNFVGGFFVCGEFHEVYYLEDPTINPGCTPIKLYTVPV